MTDKRFTIGDRALQEVYGGCIPAILDEGVPCTQSQVLKLLNELHEEVQSHQDYWKENEELQQEKEYWKEKYKALEKENERLRRCINEIYTIARLEEVD